MLHVGFDIGGTNIKAGLVDDELNILTESNKPFPRGAENKVAIDIMEEMIFDMIKHTGNQIENIVSIGIAVPGSLDPKNEIVINAHNLGFHNLELKKIFEGRFPGIPVFLANDANAAALGELHMGAFKGCKTAVLFTLGTGVGGGIILGGKLFNGGMGHGVELGHVRLVHNGALCTCGNYGCIETVCSAMFFERKGLVAKEVVENAKAGDKEALEIFKEYVDYLSDAVVSIAVLLDPEVIAIGGGISQAGNFLFDSLRKKVTEKSFFKYPHKVVPAQLGNKAGFIGAAMLKKE